jgi:hypothetical protein
LLEAGCGVGAAVSATLFNRQPRLQCGLDTFGRITRVKCGINLFEGIFSVM